MEVQEHILRDKQSVYKNYFNHIEIANKKTMEMDLLMYTYDISILGKPKDSTLCYVKEVLQNVK